jgi:GNAT superfamily N-acetyltransferase
MTTTNPAVSIRKAERADAEALIALITNLAEFEHLAPPDEAARKRLIEDGFGERPRYEAWLAECEGVAGPVGYAFCYETYSTFLAQPTFYLEDLFVLPDYRHQGVGRALLMFCMRLACERGCGRMEWTCLNWNIGAQRVYEAMGAKRMSEWYLYRMTRDVMEPLVAELTAQAEETSA